MSTLDPYQAPQGDLVDSIDGEGELRTFSSDCRIGRIRYLANIFLASLAFYSALFLGVFILRSNQMLVGVLTIILMVMLLCVTWIFMVQRLHDLNRSGWISLLMTVPIVNAFFGFYLMLWPGNQSSNNYGAKPPAPKKIHWVLACILPIAMVLIFALLAYPLFIAMQGFETPMPIQ